MTTIFDKIPVRWLRRYKILFFVGFFILGTQVFLSYKSLTITDLNTSSSGSSFSLTATTTTQFQNKAQSHSVGAHQNSVGDDEDSANNGISATKDKINIGRIAQTAPAAAGDTYTNDNRISYEELGFTPVCEINAKEAISALQRAKTKDCRKHIAHIACAIQSGHFYATHLTSSCPPGNHTANRPLGCYRDGKEIRLLSGYFTNFKTTNTPKRCTQMCLQSGYPYAGVQYGLECFCGVDAPPNSAKLADSSCNMKCTGDAKEICGGYYSMNIYETGIAKFNARIAETAMNANVQRVRIAFLLTLNGRALRQVHRLIKALYSTDHVYYIHVDARQDYLYRNLLELESKFSNIRLARKRFSTIWGGASLLTMLMQCMEDLLASSWQWDFVINLSESDFPVKTVNKLVDFLTANRGRNFVKSHGRETQRFIQKQGLDKTFVECDTHMWRIGDRQLPGGIQVDGGSDWVALSRPFVAYVTSHSHPDGDDKELLQRLLVIFRHTLLPAESFFHTVLRNSRFCDTYVDNNLHVTNWKRKLGCKCQYKHVVDWCGCSPNDFKPDDWNRLRGTESKMLFFARKFEPIINQAILLQMEEWLFGPYTSEYVNLQSYWQSLYHASDAASSTDDLTRTIGESIIRIAVRSMHLQANHLVEITNYMHQDQYKGFLVRYQATVLASNRSVTLETRIRPVQYPKMVKNLKFAKRLRNFEVSSDFDQKEQVSRNYAKMLGPRTELVLSFTLASGGVGSIHSDAAHSYNLTLLWIDPMGRLQDFNELHIEDAPSDAVHFSKAQLKHPLTPGIWTIKMIGRSGPYAQTKFLVTPLALDGGQAVKPDRARKLNGGTGLSLPSDFTLPPEWLQHLPNADDVNTLKRLALANAERHAASLLAWIDELTSRFYHARETCAVEADAAAQISTATLDALPVCKDTVWSSMAPDPKSDVNALLKRR